jgi:hypothetical protein
MVTKVAFRTHIDHVMYPKRVNNEHDNNLTVYSISKPNYERWSSATAHSPEFEGDWV